MADKSISDLRELGLSGVRANDPLAIVNVGASETMKIQVKNLIQAGIQFIDKESIPIDKLEEIPIPDGGITTEMLADHSVTAIKLADGSVCILAAGEPLNGAQYIGQFYLDTTTSKLYLWDGNTWVKAKAAGSVNTINGSDAAAYPDVTIAALQVDDTVDLAVRLIDTTGAAQFVAGPTNGAGPVTAREIVGADLPAATGTEKGAVVVNGDGLRMSGDQIEIDNDVAEQIQRSLVTYNEKGLVTGGSPLEASDLPAATPDGIGGVKPGPGLEVDVDGTIGHPTIVVPGTYPKVTVSETGHVIAGLPLEASDIPELSFDQITSGEIGEGVLGECAVNAPNICDYATCLMQEDNPGKGDFLGQFWYTPSTAQLRVYSRGSGPENIWLPVGFGSLQANNLRWGGSYDADTDTVTVVTSIGTSNGIIAGQPFPAPTDELSGLYFICQAPGNNMTQDNLQGINHTSGDWALCVDSAQGWIHIDVNAASGGGGGSAQYLNDLLDVEIGGAASPFSTAPAVALSRDQLLRYDGGAGVWRNTDIIDGGSID